MKLLKSSMKNAGGVVDWGFVKLLESPGERSARLAALGRISPG